MNNAAKIHLFSNNSKIYSKNLNRFAKIILDNYYQQKKKTDVTSSKEYETYTNTHVSYFFYLCSGIYLKPK